MVVNNFNRKPPIGGSNGIRLHDTHGYSPVSKDLRCPCPPKTPMNTSQIPETEAESASRSAGRFVQGEYRDSAAGVHGCYGQAFAISATEKELKTVRFRLSPTNVRLLFSIVCRSIKWPTVYKTVSQNLPERIPAPSDAIRHKSFFQPNRALEC
jgi:hypothetical protein